MRVFGIAMASYSRTILGIWILLVVFAIPVNGQVIWQEDFTYPNGTTTGANNNTANPSVDWTSQCPNCSSGDWFEVRSNQMEGLDVNGPATLETEWIDISAFPQGVEVLVDLDESGDMEGCPGGVSSGCNSVDWIRIEYSIDGSSYSDWTSANGGLCTGSCAGATYVTIGNFGAFTFTECPLSGDSLRLRISVQCWAQTEYLYIDNIIVQGQSCVQLVPTDSLVNISCHGETDGEIWVFPPGSQGPFSYSLNGGNFQSSNSFTGLGPGTYFVVVEDGMGQLDTLNGLIINEPDPLSISFASQEADCNVQNGTLTANVAGGVSPFSYAWNTNPTQSSSQAIGLSAGTFLISVMDNNGCTLVDSGFVTQLPPVVELGPDTTICLFNEFILDADPLALYPNALYSWNTQAFSNAIEVSETGLYQVSLLNECGLAEDSIWIEIIDDASQAFVPNAFTPNGDGLNDEFLPVVIDQTSYYIGIYDRWGRLVFESYDPGIGWDGTFNGKPLPEGVFVYSLRAGNCDQKLNQRSGSITILR